MKIIKPIFIIGTARSGTVNVYKLLTKHKDTTVKDRTIEIQYKNFVFNPRDELKKSIILLSSIGLMN